jgi:arsenate reductase
MKYRLLFVCVENSCRSQMAEAFARIHGGDRIEALSAGSRPSGRVNPTAIQVMAELGYDLSAHASTSVADLPSGEFEAIVSMGCGDACPTVPAARREDWQIPDPKGMPLEEFRAVRDRIEREILERELEATSGFRDTVIATNDPRPYASAILRYGWTPGAGDPSNPEATFFQHRSRSLRIVTDAAPRGSGPVAGLASGLGAADEELCWVLSCDLPFVTHELGRLLMRELRQTERRTVSRAVIPLLGGREQPLCAAWDAEAFRVAERCLGAGRRSVRELIELIDVRRLPEESLHGVGDPKRLLLNVNTPEDLKRARMLAGTD